MARKLPVGALKDTVVLDQPYVEERVNVEVVDGDSFLPPQEPAAETVKRMAKVVVLGPDEISAPELVATPADAIAAAFDRGAQLNMPVSPATGPIPPKAMPLLSKPKASKGGRPAGAETIQPLFATGIIVLVAFVGPTWALPTEEETSALAIPLSNILARRIDLAAKMGKDANDTIAVVIAVLSYLVRVGPKAVEVVRERATRSDPERVIRPSGVEQPDRAGVVDAGNGNGTGASGSAANSALSLIAQARDTTGRVLSRGSALFEGSADSMDHQRDDA